MAMTDESVRTIDGVPLTPKSDLYFRTPPEFDSVEEERLHRKQKLAGALRLFGKFGFSEGVAGHITVRDPEFPDMFWVNPLGMSFRHIRVSDLILCDHEGNVVYKVKGSALSIRDKMHITDANEQPVAVMQKKLLAAKSSREETKRIEFVFLGFV